MSLLSEIAGASRTTRSQREEVAADVERMCGTRRGGVLLAPAYGVDDATHLFHAFPIIDAWAARLEESLARYEPRLRQARVVPVVTEAPELTLRVEIHALLLEGGRAAPAHFVATLDPTCRPRVR